ncbi:MAG: HEPN domain-containing protein [Chloroflexi bacterium]|nr:HEPN domain-containing protein [Chloroflexota bacterium]
MANRRTKKTPSAVVAAETLRLQRAKESLLGARADFSAKRYNNVASRCYYAAFHAAVAFLINEGIRPEHNRWQHSTVWREFSKLGKRTPEDRQAGATLSSLYALRVAADYALRQVSRQDAAEVIIRASEIVTLATKRIGGQEG